MTARNGTLEEQVECLLFTTNFLLYHAELCSNMW